MSFIFVMDGNAQEVVLLLTTDRETSHQEVILIAREVDILLHARDVRVCKHGTICGQALGQTASTLSKGSWTGIHTKVIEEEGNTAVCLENGQCLVAGLHPHKGNSKCLQG